MLRDHFLYSKSTPIRNNLYHVLNLNVSPSRLFQDVIFFFFFFFFFCDYFLAFLDPVLLSPLQDELVWLNDFCRFTNVHWEAVFADSKLS